MMTAAHCFGSPWNSGPHVFGSTSFSNFCCGNVDYAMIHTGANGGSAGRIYRGQVNSAPVKGYYTGPLQIGINSVCYSGAVTLEQCGQQIIQRDVCKKFNFAGIQPPLVNDCGLIWTFKGGQRLQVGDSGGPVYNVRADG
jgi:hypothetical protein